MKAEDLKPNKILRGPIFPEPVQIIVYFPMGDAVKLIAKGLNTSRVYEPFLTPDQLAALETTPSEHWQIALRGAFGHMAGFAPDDQETTGCTPKFPQKLLISKGKHQLAKAGIQIAMAVWHELPLVGHRDFCCCTFPVAGRSNRPYRVSISVSRRLTLGRSLNSAVGQAAEFSFGLRRGSECHQSHNGETAWPVARRAGQRAQCSKFDDRFLDPRIVCNRQRRGATSRFSGA